MKATSVHNVIPRPDGPCDDRIEAFPEDQLFALIDASGPTYGGYHRPIGVEPGVKAMIEAWREVTGDPTAAMHKALAHANSAMIEAGGNWNGDAQRIIETGEGELVHPTASITVVALNEDTWAVGHVGSNAAWLVREGYAERIATPHTLMQQMIDEGRRSELEPWQSQVVTRLVGFGIALNPDVNTMTAAPGDVVVLCSRGLWQGLPEHLLEAPIRKGLRGEPLVAALLEHGDPNQDRAVLIIEGR